MAPIDTFDTVLVPLEGSELSERALPVAQDLVDRQGGRIVLSRAAVAHVPPGIDPSEQQIAVVGEAEGYLQSVVDRYDLHHDTVDLAVPYGPAAGSILLEIDLRRADLVVMSSHGRGGLKRAILGSVAADVINKSSVPVLVIPGAAPSNVRIPVAPRAVVGIDGSQLSLSVLADVMRLIGARKGSIVLTHALAPRPMIAPHIVSSPGDVGYSESDVHDYLEQVRGEIPSHSVDVQIRVARGDPATVILQAADELNADLVAVATHGRANLGKLLMGSVAQQVSQSAGLPVIVRRPGSPGSSLEWTVPDLPVF